MTSTKEIQYDILDVNGKIIPNKSTSISLKVDDLKGKYLIQKSLIIQNLKKRQGTASCKTRSEVTGGGRKPWKQKGTGRARAGSTNSPLMKGGGVTFGPKPRAYDKKINLKEKQLALRTALYKSASKMIVLENSFQNLEKPSTKYFLEVLKKITSLNQQKRLLIITHNPTENLKLAARNISNVQLFYSNNLNLRDLLLAKIGRAHV